MDIRNIAAKAERAENTGDLFPLIQDLIDYLIERERDTDDTLSNLDSSNIREIDFARTKIKNANILLKSGGTTDEGI